MTVKDKHGHIFLKKSFSVSGCTDHFEEDEESALETTRNIVATLNGEQHVTPSGVQNVEYLCNSLFMRCRANK